MARCLNLAPPALPPLPVPFTIPPFSTPPFGIGEITLCCKLPPIGIPPIPIPGIGQILFVPGVVTAIAAALTLVTDYINALPLKCPVE